MDHLELPLTTPWLNAAGTLGFAPAPPPGGRRSAAASAKPAALAKPVMGAFITNPISLSSRTPAAERCLLPFPGGALLHSGLPNPGLRRVLSRYAERWAQSPLPIWPHLIGQHPEEIQQMVRRLEGLEGVEAIEVGIPPDARGAEALAFIQAAYGELPLVAHLPLTAAGEPWLEQLPALGASALSLGGPRGALPNAAGKLVAGRLYGPALFPQMLAAIQQARRLGIPLIAGAGVYRPAQAEALLAAGARAVQIDTALWLGWDGADQPGSGSSS